MKVIYTRLALSDLAAIGAYTTEVHDFGQASSVFKKIQEGVSRLVAFPQSGRIGRVPETRELKIPETPFVVVYRLARNEIHILAILHSSRKWFD